MKYRKRAKTDDEKEQRRIERVLRNRQAAQSSRERKRQEVEKLEGEKAGIEDQNQLLKNRLLAVEHEKFLLTQKVARLTAQLKNGSTASTSPSPSPVTDTFDHAKIKQELDNEYSFLPTPALSFQQSASSFASPSTMTYSPSQSPPNIGLGLDELTSSKGMTQHPAAMLCEDLQCQPEEVQCQASQTQPTTLHTRPTVIRSFSTANPAFPTSISAASSDPTVPKKYNSSKTPLSRLTKTLSPSTPSSISTPITTPNLTTTLSVATTSTSMGRCSKPPISQLPLQLSLLISSSPLARPHQAATGPTLRLETSRMTKSEKCELRISDLRVARSQYGKASRRTRTTTSIGVKQAQQQEEGVKGFSLENVSLSYPWVPQIANQVGSCHQRVLRSGKGWSWGSLLDEEMGGCLLVHNFVAVAVALAEDSWSRKKLEKDSLQSSTLLFRRPFVCFTCEINAMLLLIL